MKLSKKLMILSLFLVIVCCIGSASATEDASDNIEISDDVDVEQSINDDSLNDDEIDKEVLSSNQENDDPLGDKNPHDEIYVNSSSEINFNDVDGQSWDQAYGQYNGLSRAFRYINDNGKIYLASGEYDSNNGYTLSFDREKNNVSFIGQDRDNTILIGSFSIGVVGMTNGNDYSHFKLRFINMTFKDCNIGMENDLEFINCNFINSSISFCGGLNDCFKTQTDLKDKMDSSLTLSFNDCSFSDYVGEQSYITSYPYGQVNISGSTFENITADSIISSSTNGIFEDGIHISDSKFSNITVNGVMDVDENYATFENNIGDVNPYRSTPEDSKITISATKEALTITLKDSEGNIIKNAPITITAPSHDPNFHREVTTNDEGIAVYNMAGADWTVWCAEYDGIKSRTFSAGPAEASVNLRTLAKTLNVQFTNVTDVTGKTILVVNVKNNLSEAVVNTNFTFTLNGKDYNATTDANGQFIASGLTGDVSAGVKYNGTEYNALDVSSNFTFPKTESEEITPTNTTPTNTTPTNTTPADDKKPTQPATDSTKINPVATKITAKKATFKKAKKAKKYTITLKAGKKAVSKVKVTIKVGKKTYTAKTNAKGKATFNLKKLTKKGKYTAVIKFKGNKNYKATSTKVKIVVK